MVSSNHSNKSMATDNIEKELDDLNLDISSDENIMENIAVEYQVSFKNFKFLGSDRSDPKLIVFSFLTQNRNIYPVDEDKIIDIKINRHKPGTGTIKVSDEISFVSILLADGQRFRQQEVNFKSMEDPDATQRIKARVFIPEAGSDELPHIDKKAGADVAISNEKADTEPPRRPQRVTSKPSRFNSPRSVHSSPRHRKSNNGPGNIKRQNTVPTKTQDVRKINNSSQQSEGWKQGGRNTEEKAKPSLLGAKKAFLSKLNVDSAKTEKRRNTSIFGRGKPREEKKEETVARKKRGLQCSSNKFGHLDDN